MKTKLFLFPVILFLICCNSQKILSQSLKVTQLINFPVCSLDSVHENDTINFSLQVVNLDSNFSNVIDTLYVFFHNDSTVSIQTEKIITVFLDSLVGHDTLNFTQIPYTFTASRYKTGNNIVVVWPRIKSDSSSTADSLESCVFFIPFSSISMLSSQNQTFSVFPNPVINEITLNKDSKKSIDYVRILNDIGQEILFKRTDERHLDVRFLSEGFYFIEIKERNGNLSRRKFLKL